MRESKSIACHTSLWNRSDGNKLCVCVCVCVCACVTVSN